MSDSELRAYALAKRGAEGGYPFGPGAFVIKVAGKVFALFSDDEDPPTVSLKVDPEEGEILRDQHATIIPGYHLNKRHWITATIDDRLPPDLLPELVDDSYALVVASLTRAKRAELEMS